MIGLLALIGCLFLFLIVVVGIGAAYLVIRSKPVAHESWAYAHSAIPAIIDGWHKTALEERLSPECRRATSDADWDTVLQGLRKLGKLKNYNGCNGSGGISMNWNDRHTATANYVASADFEAGPAKIDLKLIKHGDQWQITGLRVSTEIGIGMSTEIGHLFANERQALVSVALAANRDDRQ